MSVDEASDTLSSGEAMAAGHLIRPMRSADKKHIGDAGLLLLVPLKTSKESSSGGWSASERRIRLLAMEITGKNLQEQYPPCAPTPVETAPMEAGKEEAAVRVVKLRAVEATPESFAPFGQVVAGGTDGAKYGPDDAQLDLSRGIPRFYLMRLENQPLKFSSITHHANVTQCLGSIGGQDWYLGVAKPSLIDGPSEQSGQDGIGRKPVQSRAGHYYLPPDPAEVRVFRVSGLKFLKLHRGTWHAGPLFKADAMDFYNLELSKPTLLITLRTISRSTMG